jgi:hypothetical protein
MRHRIGQFLALSSQERLLFLQGVVLLPLTALGLCCLGLNRWGTGLNGLARWSRDKAQGSKRLALHIDEQVMRTQQILQLATRHGLYAGNCLSRSLTLWWLLRRQGIESDLRIGVRRVAGCFGAHAWVEYQGSPVNESRAVYQHYAVFTRAIQVGEERR